MQKFKIPLFVSAVKTIAAVAAMASISLHAEQVWLSQGVSAPATDALRVGFSNTLYTEHGEHFANEEAVTLRYRVAERWQVGCGITFSQDRIETGGRPAMPDEEARGDEADSPLDDIDGPVRHRWKFSKRPTEHAVLVWDGGLGDWDFSMTHRLDFYFREGTRDWIVYRNISSATAPALPRLPWTPRPYVAQQIYFTGRDNYSGWERFSQFRWFAGLRLRPCDRLSLSAYWQYRDIETAPGDWSQFRVAGLSANLSF